MQAQGAGGVDQYTARFEGVKSALQQATLHLDQLLDVAGAAQPAHVGVAAHDARGAAGRVQQDRVKGLAVPPSVRLAGVGRHRAGLQALALQGLGDAHQALGVGVQRGDVQVGQLQQVGGLASRRRAGVEHAGPGRQLAAAGVHEQRGGDLRGGVERARGARVRGAANQAGRGGIRPGRQEAGATDGAAAARSKSETDAAGIRQALGDIEAERRKILAEADAQATAILADGRARLTKEVAELEAKAAADLAAARGRSGEELRGEIARLSSAATSKAVAASLNERAQQELIESFIKSVGAAK